MRKTTGGRSRRDHKDKRHIAHPFLQDPALRGLDFVLFRYGVKEEKGKRQKKKEKKKKRIQVMKCKISL